MKSLLRLLLKSQHQRNRSGPTQTEKGMTLVELLVGAIMAFLIITPMLGFVVDMLNTDRREQVKSNTEQDLQATADFISQDLSQAIYIYDNNPATEHSCPPRPPASRLQRTTSGSRVGSDTSQSSSIIPDSNQKGPSPDKLHPKCKADIIVSATTPMYYH